MQATIVCTVNNLIPNGNNDRLTQVDYAVKKKTNNHYLISEMLVIKSRKERQSQKTLFKTFPP